MAMEAEEEQVQQVVKVAQPRPVGLFLVLLAEMEVTELSLRWQVRARTD
jgi:hypothetical protein